MIEKGINCTACGACVQRCPKGCIALTEDENGFLYPTVNTELCVGCGICDSVCPIEGDTQNGTKGQKAYAAVHTDPEVLARSTSGGAFSAIAQYVLSRGGVVYGCAYDGLLRAVHIRADSEESARPISGSKYVQSDIGDCYLSAESDLKAGKWVLFSGTPCQIAGLKSFLGCDPYTLITVDIVCHGVASHAYFAKFIEWYGRKNKVTVRSYDFRSKRNAGWSCAGMCDGERNGKPHEKKIYYFDGYYYYYFLSGSVYRDSCYQCRYASMNRTGDLTLGDLWGAEGMDLPFSVSGGCSLILANTEKARALLSELPLRLCEIRPEDAAKNNMQLRCPSKKAPEREELLRQYREWSADRIQSYFLKRYRIKRIKGMLKYSVPSWLRRLLLRLRGR